MSVPAPAPPPPPPLDPVAAVLSYLVPGLGQMVQGRFAKGLMFFVCLNGLFFYGMNMGQWKNVWLPNPTELPKASLPIIGELSGTPKSVYYRPQFLAQFWMGISAWPAIAQYVLTPVPAGDDDSIPPTKPFGHFMQAPTEADLNTFQRDGNKRWDLGWVYTVIAGVLNVLVIYDALAGPVIRDDEDAPAPPAPASATPEGPPA